MPRRQPGPPKRLRNPRLDECQTGVVGYQPVTTKPPSTLVIVPPFPPSPADELPAVRLSHLRSEITSMLEGKLEELRAESQRMHGTMEQTMFRLRTQGFEAKLDDLRSGRWHRLKTEVQTLQEVMELFGAFD